MVHRAAAMHQQNLPSACQRWSSPVQLTVLLGMLAVIGSMLAAVVSHGRAPLNWRATVSQAAGEKRHLNSKTTSLRPQAPL